MGWNVHQKNKNTQIRFHKNTVLKSVDKGLAKWSSMWKIRVSFKKCGKFSKENLSKNDFCSEIKRLLYIKCDWNELFGKKRA